MENTGKDELYGRKRLLQTLADSRNITKAADKLYITQSALSKRIRSIEWELGVELLLRSHQGIRFTPSGEAVLTHSRAAAREMEQMRRNPCMNTCISAAKQIPRWKP